MRGRPPLRHQGGFTYLGVMILVAVIALGSALTLEVAHTAERRSAEEALLAVGGEFNRAFASYFRQTPSGGRRYPQRLEDLLRDPRYPGVKRHLRQVYADPLTGRQEWGLIPAPGGGVMGVYSLAPGTPFREAVDAQEVPLRTLPPWPRDPAAPSSPPYSPAAPGLQHHSRQLAPADTETGYAAWRFGHMPSELTPRNAGVERQEMGR